MGFHWTICKWIQVLLKSGYIFNFLEKQEFKQVMKQDNEKMMKPRWSDLPKELVEVIMSKLVFIDQARVRALCKTWRSLRHIQPARQLPWLFTKEFNTFRKYYLYDPLYKKAYIIKGQGFKEEPHMYSSKNGLLLLKSETSIFLYNPFTFEKIKFPDLPEVFPDFPNVCLKFDASFECPPTSADYLICAVESDLRSKLPLCIRICRSTDKSWTVVSSKPNFNFVRLPRVNHLLYKNGLIYILTIFGNVAIFDIAHKTWSLIPLLLPFDGFKIQHSVKSNIGDEVLYVAKRYHWTIDVFDIYSCRIDRSQNKMVVVKSLGGQILFWNDNDHILLPQSATPEGMGDWEGKGDWVYDNFHRYLYPRTGEFDQINYYSLKDGRCGSGTYRMIAANDASKLFSMSKNNLETFLWIEPHLQKRCYALKLGDRDKPAFQVTSISEV